MKYHFMQNSHFMRCFLFLTVIAASTLTAHADGIGIRTVKLMVNGEPMVFSLDAKPVITFSDNTLHITTETQATPTDVPVAQVEVIEFKGAPDRADANGDNKIDAVDLSEIIKKIINNH